MAEFITVPAKVEFYIYRNEVLVSSGILLGSKQVPYNPPPGPANYRISFNVPGQYGGSSSDRTVMVLGFRR